MFSRPFLMSSLVRSPGALFPESGGSLENRRRFEDSSLGACGPSGEGVPGLQPLGEPRGTPSIPDVLQDLQGPPPLIHETEGWSVPVVHTFRPHSTPWGFERVPILGERSGG